MSPMKMGELLETYRAHIQKELSEKRYLHSVQTAQIALELLKNLPANQAGEALPFRVESAALLHDVAKELPAEKQREILYQAGEAGAAGMPGPVLHAFTGAVLIAERFGIDDPGILHAVKYHTTGCAQMPLLSRLVFAADFLESLDPEAREALQKKPLAEICIEKLISTFQYLMREKRPVQDDSLQFYNTLVISSA